MAEHGTPQHDAESLRMIAGWLREDGLRDPAAVLRRVAGDIERRATDGQRAGVPEPFASICREELARRKLTSHPLKFAFAKERGMAGIGEVHDWMQRTALAFEEAVQALPAAPTPPSYIELRQQYGEMHRERISNPMAEQSRGKPVSQLVVECEAHPQRKAALDRARERMAEQAIDHRTLMCQHSNDQVCDFCRRRAGDAGQERDWRDAEMFRWAIQSFRNADALATFVAQHEGLSPENLRIDIAAAIATSKGEKDA